MKLSSLHMVDYRLRKSGLNPWVDLLMVRLFAILCIGGLVISTSASMEFADYRYGDAFYFLKRQSFFMLIALALAFIAYSKSFEFWLRHVGKMLALCFVLLTIVLIPDVGREVNGSRRWLDFFFFTVQPSEIAKFVMIVFLADYIVRRNKEVRTTFLGFIIPISVVAFFSLLVLAEPDYGTAVLLLAIAFLMLFLAGAKLLQILLSFLVGGGVIALLVVLVPYRWARIKTFLDPWSDPFASGYQLIQSLIAVGSGGWFGQGLGDSVQKLFYLPEAHTDFIFAVIAEEFGFVGVSFVIALYAGILWRCFVVAKRAESREIFAGAFFSYGVGIWIGIQAFVNIAVVMGVLPTKGISLPAISIGGSNLVIVFIALAVVQRIHRETFYQDIELTRQHNLRKRYVSQRP